MEGDADVAAAQADMESRPHAVVRRLLRVPICICSAALHDDRMCCPVLRH